jgi:hypothetical protein
MNNFLKLPILELFIGLCFLAVISLAIYLLQLTAWFVPQSFVLATISNCRQFFVTSSNNLIGSGLIIFGIFGIGILLAIFTIMGSFLKFKLRMNELNSTKAVLPKKILLITKKLKLRQDQIIYLNSKNIIACCLGIFNPKIVISKGLLLRLSETELEAVICHEYKHLQNRHGLCLFLFSLIQSIFWISPIFSIFKIKLKQRLESAADLAVISHFKSSHFLDNAKNALSNQVHTRYEFSLNFSNTYSMRNIVRVSQKELIFKSLISFAGGTLLVWCLFSLNKPLEIKALEPTNSNESCISNSTVENLCLQKTAISHKTCEWRNYSSL